MSSREEIVSIVDREDNVVDEVPRHVMRAQSLRHRVTYIFVFDSTGRLFVQKRTPTKDLYPGYFDLAAGGVVCAGESYEDSAAREAQEELGITDTPLQPLFKFYFEDDDDNKSWGMVFFCTHDGPFVLQEEEVESGEFVEIDTILKGSISSVTPDTRAVLDRLLAEREPDPMSE